MRSQSPNFRRVPTSSSQESDERPTRASRPRKRPWDIGRSPGSRLASRAGSAPRSRSPTTPGGWPARHPVVSAPRRQRSTLSRWPVNATSDGPCTLVLRTASPRTVVPAQKVPSTRRDLWERMLIRQNLVDTARTHGAPPCILPRQGESCPQPPARPCLRSTRSCRATTSARSMRRGSLRRLGPLSLRSPS